MRFRAWLLYLIVALANSACAARVHHHDGERPDPPASATPMPSPVPVATSLPEPRPAEPPPTVRPTSRPRPLLARPTPPPRKPPAKAKTRPKKPAPPAMPKLTEILSPNFNEREGAPITAIVLHHTASPGNAAAIADYFHRADSRVSSHYIVDRNGAVIRCVPDSKRAWHAGPSSFCGVSDVNDYSIGIEICNRGDDTEVYPPKQVLAVTRLVAALARIHRIPLSRVTRHRDVAIPAGIKIDPSNNFDLRHVVTVARTLLGRPVTRAAGLRRPSPAAIQAGQKGLPKRKRRTKYVSSGALGLS